MLVMPVDETLLRTSYTALEDKPLEPQSNRYEDVYAVQHDRESPIEVIKAKILWEGNEGIHLISGFRGSGKTTELKRMKFALEQEGCFVVMADALDYLNPAGVIEITDLLLVLAGAFQDQLPSSDVAKVSIWEQFRTFLSSEVQFSEVSAEFGIPENPFLNANINLKGELKASPDFRRMVQAMLKSSIGNLKNRTDKFFEDAVKHIRSSQKDKKIVFIFDSLEKLRGSSSEQANIQKSVELLFSDHFDKLEIPYIHVVYTVPPWLKLRVPRLANSQLLRLLPSIKQKNRDGTVFAPGSESLKRLLERRLGKANLEAIFGQNNDYLDQLVSFCGGHFRDLLLLVRQVLLRSRLLDVLPVTQAEITYALNELRRDYLPISVNDAFWLKKIMDTHDPHMINNEEAAIRLSTLLDTHTVLFLKNGDEWYDVHPLIHDEVKRIVAQNEPNPTTPNGN
jgi:hypothetical protein